MARYKKRNLTDITEDPRRVFKIVTDLRLDYMYTFTTVLSEEKQIKNRIFIMPI